MNAGIFWLLLAIFGMLWVIAAGLGHEAAKREGNANAEKLSAAIFIATFLAVFYLYH